jgi:hypothetical protein
MAASQFTGYAHQLDTLSRGTARNSVQAGHDGGH